MSKWISKAWGIKVDNTCTGFNFLPAWKAGASFCVYELNPEFEMFYNSWVNGLAQPYLYKVPVVGIYKMSVDAVNSNIPDLGNVEDIEGRVDLESDKIWLHLESLIKSKWINTLVINYVDFYDKGNLDKPIAFGHVLPIIRETMKRIRIHAPQVNNKIKKILIQIDENIINEMYPDLGGILGEEDFCLTDFQTMPKVISMTDWNTFSDYLPPDKLYFGGEEHDNPPISYTKAWAFWKFADFNNGIKNGFMSGDFQRPEGKGIMGGVLFNGDRNQLATFFDMVVPNYTDGAIEPPVVEPPPVEPPHTGNIDIVGIKNKLIEIKDSFSKISESINNIRNIL